MKSRTLTLLVVGGLLGVAAMACSAAPPAENTQDKNQTGRKHGNDDTSSNGSNGDSPSTSPDEATPPSTPGTTPPAADGGTEGGTTTTPPPGALVCTPVATCTNVKPLKSISGDGTEQTSITGAGSTWLSIHIREDSFSDVPIGFSAELYSPPGSTYEMHVYTKDCKTALGTSTQLEDGAEGVASWDDTGFLDDAKDVMIEIRHTGGTCTATEKWTLDVLGNVF